MNKEYDVIIVGGGPGGYSAALYCARGEMSTLVLEKFSPGGQMATTSQLDNYPGFDQGIDGFELSMKMKDGAERFGAETKLVEVLSIDASKPVKKVVTAEGEFFAKTVVVATGASARKLGLPEEEGLLNKGVAYCATCDGMFYRGKKVIISGGGNTAVADALYLSKICEKVTIVHRRDQLRATPIYRKILEETDNIEILWDSVVKEILHEDKVTGAIVENLKTGEKREVEIDGLFVAIGRIPNTDAVKNVVELDDQGYIVADEMGVTNIPGVYGIGDVRTKKLRQVITAAGDGANVSMEIEEYINENFR